MAKVDGSLGSLIQGVSQQPPRTRLPGQCTAQDNISSNPVDGLTRRAAMEEVLKLFSAAPEAQFYDFDLGGDLQFIMACLPGVVRVFNYNTGVESTVNNVSSGFSYIDGASLAFTTLDDLVYVANKSKVVAMDAAVKSYVQTGSIAYVLGGSYGRVYNLTITWSGGTIVGTFTTPNGSVATDVTQITTDYIATQITASLNANGTFTANFSVTRVGDVMYIKKTSAPTSQVFNCTTTDGFGGTQFLVINNTIQDRAKLPRYAPHNYVVTITGDGSTNADEWYAQFICNKDSAGNYPALGAGFGLAGAWQECVAPDTPYKFDIATMPHVLFYDFNTGIFSFGPGNWAERAAGDTQSNEDPTFVDETVEGLGYFQGRLVLLGGAAVCMSRTDRPLDHWNNSATEVADSDPIDIQSTIEGVRKMYHCVPFNRDLVVFSDKGQFIVFGRTALTPQNSSLVLTTTFEVDITATPVAAGRNVFFPIAFGQFTGIREFYASDSQDANDSRPITQHVLKYLEGTVKMLSTSSNFDILLVQTITDSHIVYSYEYIWQDDKKVQSAWSRWILPDNVKYIFIIKSKVYIITKIGNDYMLNTMDLDVQDDTGLTYNVRLDRKKDKTAVNFTIANPYNPMPSDPASIVFIQGEGCPTPGMVAWVESYNAGTNTYTFDRDMEGGTVIYGVPYRSSYIPTEPDVKDSDKVRIGTGKLIVGKFLLNCKATGKLLCRKFSKYAADVVVEFTGRFVGDPNTHVGEPAIVDASYIMPFRSEATRAGIELYSDSHLPFTVTDIEWKGQYTKKGQRIQSGGN